MGSKHILQVGEGEVLSLPAPFAVQVTIKSGAAGDALAVGLLTLPPGAALPSHRFLHYDYAGVVLKGQGRATVGSQTATVVPGVGVTVPRQTWQSLRNTGTGALQLIWTASSPAILAFFRELVRAADAPAVHAAAHRHGVELGGEPIRGAVPPPRRRRRRRGGARPSAVPPARAEPGPPQPPSAPRSEASRGTVAAPQAGQPVAGISAPGGGRHRRHGRRGARPSPVTRAASPRSARDRSRRGGRVKEVYMGGRWVRVEGEGPVIASGE